MRPCGGSTVPVPRNGRPLPPSAPTRPQGPPEGLLPGGGLMGPKPPISCLLVHTDETTGSRDLAAVSMPGAQREITGQLIGEGYRPDGPWVDIDPAAPEAMRKFQSPTGAPAPGGAA